MPPSQQHLPSRPNLDQLRKQAKDLLAAWRADDPDALSWLREHHPEHATAASPPVDLRLADAQLVTARRYGFPSWPRLKEEVELANLKFEQRVSLLVRAAVDASTGPVDGSFLLARRMLTREPALARAGVYTALVLGDTETVRRQIADDPEWVRTAGGPAKRQPLSYVTYSKFHRDSPQTAEGLLAIARLLLDHGADPNAPFLVPDWANSPLRPLLGACGVANFPTMAELLLDRGASMDDNESVYHSLEHPDTRCLELLLARGAATRATNALNHAFDFKGPDRVRLLLEHGADPNEEIGENGPPLFVAIQKGHGRTVLEMLVAHGADVHARRADGRSAWQVAMQHGQQESADYLAELGAAGEATPFERFAAACGQGDVEAARRVVVETPGFFGSLSHQDYAAFLRLAQLGKAEMIAAMIDGGFPAGLAGPLNQTALHWACWHGWRDTVEALLSRGAEIDAKEKQWGATPLGWAVHGSDNWPNPDGDYPGTVRLLLARGASVNGVQVGGSPEVADLLRAAGAEESEEE